MKLKKLADEIIAGRRLKHLSEVLGEQGNLPNLLNTDIKELMEEANRIREELCGNGADLCSIINGRSGRCSEDCKFCAQSYHNHTGVEEYNFLDLDAIRRDCRLYDSKGVNRYSIVTAGRTIEGEDLDMAVRAYSTLSGEFPKIKLCGSHGLMSREAFKRLKEAGVDTIHCNIETSRRYFPHVCSTHTFDEKLEAIAAARALGLRLCCGGIIGMGETWEDRIQMTLTIAELKAESIPINTLIPIEGTPFAGKEKLPPEDILRTVALFRWINPEAHIRIAAGRYIFDDGGTELFKAGANATITGDMLTTVGNNTDEDRKMLSELGFTLRPAKQQ